MLQCVEEVKGHMNGSEGVGSEPLRVRVRVRVRGRVGVRVS